MKQRLRLAGLRTAGQLYRRGPGSGQPAPPRSVLLIRPDHLGDLLFLTPALHALRLALPAGTRLALLAGPWGAEAVAGNPDLDEIRICRFPGFERRPKSGMLAPYRLLFAQAREIESAGYDASVVLRSDHWWGAWLAAAAGIPRRIGYAWPETSPFLTEALPYCPARHEVEQNGVLLSALAACVSHPLAPAVPPDAARPEAAEPSFYPLGPLRYAVAGEDRAWAAAWLAARGIEMGDVQGNRRAGSPLVGIHPGAGARVKQWPPSAWAEVANGLCSAVGARFLLTGGPAEKDLAAGVARSLSLEPLNAAGETASVGQLAALLASCDLVLGSDSGPLHLAVATGVPTIHLYGPVDPARFGPWGNPARHRVISSPWACVPCNRLDWPAPDLRFHGCMATIDTETVLATAVGMLRDKRLEIA